MSSTRQCEGTFAFGFISLRSKLENESYGDDGLTRIMVGSALMDRVKPKVCQFLQASQDLMNDPRNSHKSWRNLRKLVFIVNTGKHWSARSQVANFAKLSVHLGKNLCVGYPIPEGK